MTAHWTKADFVQTEEHPAFDGSAALTRYGYCGRCYGDMRCYGREGQEGVLRHYQSHSTHRRMLKAQRLQDMVRA